jgi:hypothetical protein
MIAWEEEGVPNRRREQAHCCIHDLRPEDSGNSVLDRHADFLVVVEDEAGKIMCRPTDSLVGMESDHDGVKQMHKRRRTTRW